MDMDYYIGAFYIYLVIFLAAGKKTIFYSISFDLGSGFALNAES